MNYEKKIHPRAGTRLKRLRKSRGMTQEQLGEHLGVKKAAISKYENHTRELNSSTIFRLAEIFKVDPGYFLNSEEQD